MKRQSRIYIVFAFGSAALLAYVLTLCATAWNRFGTSSNFTVVVLLALCIGAIAAFYAWMSLLFTKRSVGSIARVGDGFLLLPSDHCAFGPVQATKLHLRRTIGEQFSRDESEPKFSLFVAAGRHWVTSYTVYQGALVHGAKE